MHPYSLTVPAMSCGSCVGRIEKAISDSATIGTVAANLATQTVQFQLEEPSELPRIVGKLETLGYPPLTVDLRLNVQEMHCASCVSRVENLLTSLDVVQKADVNLAAQTASLEVLAGEDRTQSIIATLAKAGFPAQHSGLENLVPSADQHADIIDKTQNRSLLAAALVIPIVILEMGSHLFPSFHHWIAQTIGMQTSWAIQAVLATLVLFWPGRDFFRIGLRNLIARHPDMNSLVALGAGSAWLYSMVVLVGPWLMPAQGRAVYFEAAAVIVVLILIGRWMEARAKGRTGAAIKSLLNLQPRTALRFDGTEPTKVPLSELKPADRVLVRAGARIPIDAKVLKGESYIDESMMTGEPSPVLRSVGDMVIGGTLNGNAVLECSVERIGGDTVLAQIIKLVQEAQSAKLPIQSLVDRVTLWFVPIILAIAAVTVVTWLLIGPSLGLALVAGVSVLIIACPCAMGLATPTSIMVGTGRAAELGVLFRKGDALQSLSNVKVVAFDKTGTLTQGRPVVSKIVQLAEMDQGDILHLAMSLETLSDHPLAQAIVGKAKQSGLSPMSVDAFQSEIGAGVSGMVNGVPVAVGTARFLTSQGMQINAYPTPIDGETVVLMGAHKQAVAAIYVADMVKSSATATIEALTAKGVTVAMITGDRADTAHAIGHQLGITEIIAEVLPDGKAAAITALGEKFGPVAFVGDGINDAPALAQAHVGIAVGTGTDVAIDAADVVLMGDDLVGVLTAHTTSVATMGNIRQNLLWAFGYNVALIPVAAGVLYPAFGILLSPMFAAGAMALSSVCVLSNALRLRRLQKS